MNDHQNPRLMLKLPPDIAQVLFERAAQRNLSPALYVQQLVSDHLGGKPSTAPATETAVEQMLRNVLYLQLCTIYWAALHWCAGPPKKRLSSDGLNHFAGRSREFASELLQDFLPTVPDDNTVLSI